MKYLNNRRNWLTRITACVVLFFVILSTAEVKAALPALKKGDVLLTRNAVFNIVPGYWNHSAIYDGNGNVIEAQVTGQNVVKKTSFTTFTNKYPEIVVYRLNAQYLVPRMVDRANQLVGQPYSLFVGNGGYSCVALVRFSYYYATLAYVQGGENPSWMIPDNITTDWRFVYIGKK